MEAEKLSYLADLEVMSWQVEKVPHAATEGQGPIVVKREGEIIAVYPWWAHPVTHKGVVYLLDPRRGGQKLGEHRLEGGIEVMHHPNWAGLY
jgi:hypothetical protein